ncbi:MAG: hypothetical protein NTZ74_05170 [Chloroflexi bacterium]|nr:hypothetical protein [Chloroflexota bacterium]
MKKAGLMFLVFTLFVCTSCNTSLSSPLTSPISVNDQVDVITSKNTDRLVELNQKGYGSINDIRVSADSKQIAIAFSTGILLIDSSTLSTILFIKTEAEVTELMFSSDSTKLISRLNDDSIKVWSVKDGSFLFNLQGLDLIAQDNLSLSLNGNYIIDSGSTSDQGIGVYIWNVSDGSIYKKLNPYNDITMTSLEISPDGKFVAAGNEEGWLTIWDLEGGEILQRYEIYHDYSPRLMTIQFFPDGKSIVASNGIYPRYTIWDVSTGEKIENIPDHNFKRAEFSPDGTLMYFIDAYGLNIWNTESGEFKDTNDWQLDKPIYMTLFPDGSKTAIIEQLSIVQYSIEVRQTDNGVILKSRDIIDYKTDQLSYTTEGFLFGSVFNNSNCSFIGLNLETDKILYNSTINSEQCPNGFFPSDKGIYPFINSIDGTFILYLIDKEDDFSGHEVFSSIQNDQFGQILGISPNGSILVTYEYTELKPNLVIWNMSDFTVLATINEVIPLCSNLAFSSNSTSFTAVTCDGNLMTWDSYSASVKSAYDLGSNNKNFFIVLSKDGAKLILYDGNEIYLFDNLNKSIENLGANYYISSATCITFSPDNELVAIGGAEGKFEIWDTTDATKLKTISSDSYYSSIIFSPDGKQLVSASVDGIIRFYGITH